jgi:hypothetical protein
MTIEDAAPGEMRARRRWRMWPMWRIIVAALIPVGLLVAMISWAFSSAVGASPDDDYHMASIWCAQGPRDGLCEQGDSAGHMKVPERLLTARCYAFKPTHSAVCPLSERLVDTTRGNFNDHGYPPVYYAVMSVFAQPDIDVAVLTIRIVNALIFVGMMTALFLMHQVRRRGVVLWSTVGILVPFGLFIIPSINPSSWAVTSAATLWLALAGFYEASTRGRIIGFGVMVLLATVLGAGARADAAIYGVLAAGAVVLLKWRRAERFWLRSLIVVVIVAICAVSYLSSGQSGAVSGGPATPLSGMDTLRLAVKDFLSLPWMWVSTFGQSGLGWLDTFLPEIVWMPALAIAAALAFHGLRHAPWRKSTALTLVTLALIAVPLYVIVKERVIVGQFVQPRYIFPMVVLFAGLCLWGLRGLNINLSGAQLSVIGGGLALANFVALHTNTRRYVAGTATEGLDLNRGLAWWWHVPFGPNWVLAAGTLAFLVALVAAVLVSWPRWASPDTLPLRERVAVSGSRPRLRGL